MNTYYQYRNGFLERIEIRPEETGCTAEQVQTLIEAMYGEPTAQEDGQVSWADPVYSKYITLSSDEQGCLVTVGNYSVGITNVLSSYPVRSGQASITDPEDTLVWEYLCSILPWRPGRRSPSSTCSPTAPATSWPTPPGAGGRRLRQHPLLHQHRLLRRVRRERGQAGLEQADLHHPPRVRPCAAGGRDPGGSDQGRQHPRPGRLYRGLLPQGVLRYLLERSGGHRRGGLRRQPHPLREPLLRQLLPRGHRRHLRRLCPGRTAPGGHGGGGEAALLLGRPGHGGPARRHPAEPGPGLAGGGQPAR